MERIITSLESISLWENDGSAYPLYHKARAYHGLIYSLEGEGERILNGKKQPMLPNSISYLREGQEYAITLTKPPVRCYVINFHLSAESFYSESFALPDPTLSFRSRFRELTASWQTKEHLYDLVCLSGVYGLMADVLKARHQAATPSPRKERLERSVAYLHAHFANPQLRTKTLADIAGLSTRRYAECFRALYHRPPKRYLLLLRVEKAKDMLVSSGLSVNDIAAACGFTDPFYFSRVFKSITGVAPSDYRPLFRGV